MNRLKLQNRVMTAIRRGLCALGANHGAALALIWVHDAMASRRIWPQGALQTLKEAVERLPGQVFRLAGFLDAKLLAAAKRVPVLVDCDLTGTSLADGLRLRAPEELPGHGGIVVRFSRTLLARKAKVDADWLFAIDELDVAERAADLEEAKRKAADRLAQDVNRLTRAFVDELSESERVQRRKLLENVDLLGGDIGIEFPADRWLLGRVKGTLFEPVQDDFRPLLLPPSLQVQEPSDPGKLWFARVATYRDGRPNGEILKLEPAPDEGSAAGTP